MINDKTVVTERFCAIQHQGLKEHLAESDSKLNDVKDMVTDLHDSLYKNGFSRDMATIRNNQKWHWKAISGLSAVTFGLLVYAVKAAYFN